VRSYVLLSNPGPNTSVLLSFPICHYCTLRDFFVHFDALLAKDWVHYLLVVCALLAKCLVVFAALAKHLGIYFHSIVSDIRVGDFVTAEL